MKSLQEQIKVIQDQIRIKQRRIDQGKGNGNFKLCDELSDKVRSLLREKHDLGKQLAALQKLEAKSKWYHKKVKLSKNRVSETTTTPSGSTTDTTSDTASDVSSPHSATSKCPSPSISQFFKNAETSESVNPTQISKSPETIIPDDEGGYSSGGDTVLLDDDGYPLAAPPLLIDN